MNTDNTKSTTSSTTKGTTKVYTIDPMMVTPELYIDLSNRFTPRSITPSSTMQEIMFSAGEQRVLNYIKSLVNSKTVSGDQLLAVKPRTYQNRTSKFLRMFHGNTDSTDQD